MESDLNYIADTGAGFLVGMIYTAAAICVIARGPIIMSWMFKKYGRALHFLGGLVYALAFGAPIYLAVYGLSPRAGNSDSLILGNPTRLPDRT